MSSAGSPRRAARGCSSVAERQPSRLETKVRFLSTRSVDEGPEQVLGALARLGGGADAAQHAQYPARPYVPVPYIIFMPKLIRSSMAWGSNITRCSPSMSMMSPYPEGSRSRISIPVPEK